MTIPWNQGSMPAHKLHLSLHVLCIQTLPRDSNSGLVGSEFFIVFRELIYWKIRFLATDSVPGKVDSFSEVHWGRNHHIGRKESSESSEDALDYFFFGDGIRLLIACQILVNEDFQFVPFVKTDVGGRGFDWPEILVDDLKSQ